MDDALNELGAYLADRLGPALVTWQVALGELTIEVERGESYPRSSFCATIRSAASAASSIFAASTIRSASGVSTSSIIC